MDLYKEQEINVVLPKGFMNVGVAHTNDYPYCVLIANTNNSDNWDELKFPLPLGNWSISKYYGDGKTVTLVHKAVKRTFFSKWF